MLSFAYRDVKRMPHRTMNWQVRMIISVFSFGSVFGQVSYSTPEEMLKGSLVGNIAQDLGLDIKRLKSGNAHLYTGDGSDFIELNKERGVLLIKERIDREELCGRTSPCALHFQIILENPIEYYGITVEVVDINDNAPSFKKNEMRFEISESALPGARFVLEKAIDPDVGFNGLQGYSLKPIDNFRLKLHSLPDGTKNVEMVLQKQLDREEQNELQLTLTAMDGGDTPKSGTVQIRITVLDANDNAPICAQSVYKASIIENAAVGTILTTVSASDADEGSHGTVTYSISNTEEDVADLFEVDQYSGEVKLTGNMDFEKEKHFEINIEARDYGGLSDSCKIIVDVVDTNDNMPVINIMSKSKFISEDSKGGTVLAIINIQDSDSGKHGQVNCALNENIPFSIKSTSINVFSVVSDNVLDREADSEFSITVTCSDEGEPPLSSSVNVTVQVSDVNDNTPVFEKGSYEVHIKENNNPGVSIFSLKASDADWNQNARVSYTLEEGIINGVSVSSYVSVDSDSGVIRAVRSFDYEQIKEFQFRVKAQDGGSPPLSSNTTVRIFIQDKNDNPPQILYPVQTSSNVMAEMLPRTAEVGYLVTKVVAVDVDSGQNSWLSYKLLKATDRALFDVGLQNGEIRTARQVTDRDAMKQGLTIVVADNGKPARSATVNVNVAVADSFPEVLSEFTDFPQDKDYNSNLTFYLVLALAVVSVLFIVSIISILAVKCHRWRREQLFYKSSRNLPVIPYYPPLYADVGGTGTLQHAYNYELCRTADSRKSDMKCVGPCSQSLISLDASGTQTLPHAQKNGDSLDAENQVSHFDIQRLLNKKS